MGAGWGGGGLGELEDVPSSWPRLVGAVLTPETVPALEGSAWDEFLLELRGNGLFPLAYRALRESGCSARLGSGPRSTLEETMTAYRAGWASSWEEDDRLLEAFVGEGLHPILLKGAHLSLRAYPEAHLRPMSDLDVLFPSLEEADRAFALAKRLGYASTGIVLGGYLWAQSHHLPELLHPVKKSLLEVHGSLVWPPRDERWTGGACRLMEHREAFVHRGLAVEGLAPEANVVFLCAHMFLHHAGDAPKAVVLFDLRYLVSAAGERFDWARVVDLARAARFQAPVFRGLGLAKRLVDLPVPTSVLDALAPEAQSLHLDPAAWNAQKVVGHVLHAGGALGPARLAWNLMMPPQAYLRARYPELAAWPLWALYPYRWWSQAGKMLHWAAARLGAKGRPEA